MKCAKCSKVVQEELDWIADNPFYTKRFAFHVGRQCRSATIKEVAKEHKLRWHTVKELEKQYMQRQLEVAGSPKPRVIGIDEISIRKGHTYRIVVSDLERKVPIWFGGKDRSEQSLDEFYAFLGDKSSKQRTLAEGAARYANIRARMLVLTICDEQGVRLFADNEISVVSGLPAHTVDKLWDASCKLVGLRPEDVEKN